MFLTKWVAPKNHHGRHINRSSRIPCDPSLPRVFRPHCSMWWARRFSRILRRIFNRTSLFGLWALLASKGLTIDSWSAVGLSGGIWLRRLLQLRSSRTPGWSGSSVEDSSIMGGSAGMAEETSFARKIEDLSSWTRSVRMRWQWTGTKDGLVVLANRCR